MSFDPARPCNDLPSLPPSQDVETKAVLKACVEARAALAELKISGQLIPNPSVLINSIPLLEAQAIRNCAPAIATPSSKLSTRKPKPISSASTEPPNTGCRSSKKCAPITAGRTSCVCSTPSVIDPMALPCPSGVTLT